MVVAMCTRCYLEINIVLDSLDDCAFNKWLTYRDTHPVEQNIKQNL